MTKNLGFQGTQNANNLAYQRERDDKHLGFQTLAEKNRMANEADRMSLLRDQNEFGKLDANRNFALTEGREARAARADNLAYNEAQTQANLAEQYRNAATPEEQAKILAKMNLGQSRPNEDWQVVNNSMGESGWLVDKRTGTKKPF